MDSKQEEEAEFIAKRDLLIYAKANEKRYSDALNEVEAFFNTMYPIVMKHTETLLEGKNYKKSEAITVVLLQGYLSIWNTLLMRKYK